MPSEKIKKKIKNYRVSNTRTRKSIGCSSSKDLEKQNLSYMSIKYETFTREGRQMLIRDFLYYDGYSDENYDNNIKFLQKRDKYLGHIYEECLFRTRKPFVIIDKMLYKTLDNHYRLCIPTDLLEKVIPHLHEKLLHCSKRKCKITFKKYFFHPLAEVYITNYINKCMTCQCNSLSQIPGKSLKTGNQFIAKSSRELLNISIIRNLPKSNNNYCNILLLVDKYTNFCISLPLMNIESSTLGKYLNLIFSTIGFPRCVRTDGSRELNNALVKLADVISFEIFSSDDNNGKIKNTLKKYIYDEDLNMYKPNWANLLHSAMDKINKLQVDGSHMTREDFFYKSTARNIFNMLGSGKIFEYVNNNNETMTKFIKIKDVKNREKIKKSKLSIKLGTIHSGDIVLFPDKINPELDASNLHLELFQVLRKNRKAKTVEIISLRTGQKHMTTKNLIGKILVNDLISVNNAEKCIREIFRWETFTQDYEENIRRNKEGNTVNSLHTETCITEIENMLELENSFMDTEYEEWKQKPPDWHT